MASSHSLVLGSVLERITELLDVSTEEVQDPKGIRKGTVSCIYLSHFTLTTTLIVTTITFFLFAQIRKLNVREVNLSKATG